MDSSEFWGSRILIFAFTETKIWDPQLTQLNFFKKFLSRWYLKITSEPKRIALPSLAKFAKLVDVSRKSPIEQTFQILEGATSTGPKEPPKVERKMK